MLLASVTTNVSSKADSTTLTSSYYIYISSDARLATINTNVSSKADSTTLTTSYCIISSNKYWCIFKS